MALTPLQNKVLSEIIGHVRRENLPEGTRITEAQFARLLGTARSPIRAALAELKRRKVVRFEKNRGFFLLIPAAALADLVHEVAHDSQDRLYLQIAEGRLNREIPDEVVESELIRRFRVSRSRLRRTLGRILQEGWIERRVGRGWAFLPMLDSAEAYQEALHFRIGVETSGILSPNFQADPAALAQCRERQAYLLKEGLAVLTQFEIWEENAQFHERVATWSGNRFIVQAVQRLAHLQALVGFREREAPANVSAYQKQSFAEHVAMLDEIAERDFGSAAKLMRQHLESAKTRTPFVDRRRLEAAAGQATGD